jgi:hypothetical protein
LEEEIKQMIEDRKREYRDQSQRKKNGKIRKKIKIPLP